MIRRMVTRPLILFGLNEGETGQPPEFAVPLVHPPAWPLGILGTDEEEGKGAVTLPLLDNVILLQGGEIVDG